MKRLFPYLVLVFSASLFAQGSVLDDANRRATAAELNREAIEMARKERYDEAVRKFKQAAALQDKDSSKTYNNMGFAYELSGDNLSAIGAYRSALKRNPNLVTSMQNLGRLLYLGGQYNESILHGEKALSLDPNNKEVPKWLPDAYQKQTEQRMFDLKKKRREQELGKDPEEEQPKKQRRRRGYVLELGYKILNVHKFKKDRGVFTHHTQQGVLQIPMALYGRFWPAPQFQINFDFGTPYFGTVHPTFLAGRQRLEFIHSWEKFFFGVGLLFNQVDVRADVIPRTGSDVIYRRNTEESEIVDTKFGLIFGITSKSGSMLSTKIYPRVLARNPQSGPQSDDLDAAMFEIEYMSAPITFGNTKTNWPLKIFFSFMIDEIYITEYKAISGTDTVGHYFGTYDINIGTEIGKLEPQFKGIPVTIGIMFTERLYMQDLDDTDSFAFGNGQGYFGLDSGGALEGNTFSGFRSNSHIITIFSRQLLFDMVYLKETFAYEITLPSEESNALYMGFNVAVRF